MAVYITPEDYEKAEKNGIKNLYNRVHVYGWSIRRAVNTPPRKRTNRDYWKEVAIQNGINLNTFFSRIHRSGWSEEEAATTPVMTPEEVARKGGRKKKS